VYFFGTNLPFTTDTVSKPPSKAKNHHQLALAISLSVTFAIIFVVFFVCWLSYCRWRLPFASAGNYLIIYILTTETYDLMNIFFKKIYRSRS
jgi:hypothetical protein